MPESKDKRLIFLEAIQPFLSPENYRNVATNIDIIEQRLASQGYLGNYVKELEKQLEIAAKEIASTGGDCEICPSDFDEVHTCTCDSDIAQVWKCWRQRWEKQALADTP